MSALTITGLTVTCDFGDKSYGNGTGGGFMSLSSKIPEGARGIPLTALDTVIEDGLDLYFTAWATLLQTRYASGEIDSAEFVEQLAAYKLRIAWVHRLFQKTQKNTTEELKELLRKEAP